MRSAQQRLVAIADQSPPPAPVTEPALDRFLSGLRTAWKEGEIRPTAKLKPKQKRERRRPDPFAGVTDQVRAWFDEEPRRTSRELLERLQAGYPEKYWWFANKQQPGRGSIGKSALEAVAVLDVTALSQEQLHAAEEIFEEHSSMPFSTVDKLSRMRHLLRWTAVFSLAVWSCRITGTPMAAASI